MDGERDAALTSCQLGNAADGRCWGPTAPSERCSSQLPVCISSSRTSEDQGVWVSQGFSEGCSPELRTLHKPRDRRLCHLRAGTATGLTRACVCLSPPRVEIFTSSPKLIGRLDKITDATCPAHSPHFHVSFLSPPTFQGNVSLCTLSALFLPNLGLEATAFPPGRIGLLFQQAFGVLCYDLCPATKWCISIKSLNYPIWK